MKPPLDIAAAALATTLLTAATVHADQRVPRASLIDLEVLDSGTKPGTVRLSVPILDTMPARLETQTGGSVYRVSLHRSSQRASRESLHIELDRRALENRDRDNADLKLDVQLPLPVGKRVIVAELRRPGGTTTRVLASAR